MKKAFLIYLDSLAILDELSDAQAGQLFKAIKQYNEGEEPTLDFALKLAFIPFKTQFKRDLEKYEDVSRKNSENVRKRWENAKAKNTKVYDRIESDTINTINTDKDKDIDTDKEIDKESINKDFISFWTLYDKKVDRARVEKAFNKLNTEDKKNALKFLPSYISKTPNKAYRKNPLTWINGKNWLDEIEELEDNKNTVKKYIPTL